MRIISESDWETFIKDGTDDTDMSSAHIGYIAKRRQLLIKNENSDVFIYDLVLRAWTKGIGKITVSTNMTNFALDSDQDLFYVTHTDSTIRTWNPNSSTCSNFLYISKDIDFGEPSVRKKIYKVYVSYCSDSNGVPTFTYGVNGDTTPATAVSSGSFSGSQSKWAQAEFKFGTDVNKCYSFQFKIAGTAGLGFEINDITIVYRLKTVK